MPLAHRQIRHGRAVFARSFAIGMIACSVGSAPLAAGPCKPVPTTCNLSTCENPGRWEIGFEGVSGLPVTVTNLSTGAVMTKSGAALDEVPLWRLIGDSGSCSSYRPTFFIDNDTNTDCHIPQSADAILTFNTVTYRIRFGSLGAVLFRGSTSQCALGGLDSVYGVTSAGVTRRWGNDKHQLWGWPDACSTAADCNDGSSCTQDHCSGGVCSHTPTVCNSPEPYCYDASCDPSVDDCVLTPSANYDVPFPCGAHWCVCE